MSPLIRRAWLTVRVDARLAWHELMQLVDSRTVRLFQVIVYLGCYQAGIYAAFFSEPASVVDKAMGSAVYVMWVWLNIFCPLFVALGCYLARDRGNGNRASGAITNGYLLQLAGNLGMVVVFGGYVSALLAAAWWGKGTYAVFTTTALALCALLLVFGDIRRLFVHSERSN